MTMRLGLCLGLCLGFGGAGLCQENPAPSAPPPTEPVAPNADVTLPEDEFDRPEPDPDLVAEEVEVIGTRRESDPWQIPISSTEISGLELQQRDIADLTTLSEKIVGFFHSESIVSSDRFFLRGLGTIGTNPGFDQAVGLSVDGLNLARSRFGRTTFLDLQSAVLYKGAVNEASAKNSPAGLLQLRTADAQKNNEGYVSWFQHVDAAPGSVVDIASNIHLSSRWAMRLAGRVELRQGWVNNPSIGESAQQKRDYTLRAKWNGQLDRKRDLELMYQFGALNREGRNRELAACLAEPGRDDCVLDRSRYGVPTAFGGGGIGIEFFNTDYHLLALELLKPRQSGQATHLLNFAFYDADDYYDADQSYERRDHSLVSTRENYTQFDYEYRWQTQRDHWFNFRLAFRFGASIVNFNEASILCGNDFTDAGVLRARAECSDSTRADYQGAQRNVDVDHIEISALYYNQFEFRLSPTWRIEGALRFSFIDKIVDGRAFLSEPWRKDQPLIDPLGSDFVSCLDYVERRQLATELTGRELVCHEPLRQHNLNYGFNNHFEPYLWQPSLSLVWAARGQTVFVRASRSVKNFGYEIWPIVFGLGFNFIDGLSPLFPEQYMFRAEYTRTVETGGTHSWLNDTILFKWSAWLVGVDDLQVSNYDSFLQRQYVANAATASSRGADIEWQYTFVPRHSFSVTAAFTVARYDDYPLAPCYENQTAEQGCFALVRGSEFFDVLDRAQSLSGQSLEYAPKWQYSLGYDGEFAISDSWKMELSTDFHWRGRYFIGTSHHPVFDVQNPVVTIDTRIAFASVDWQIALIGRNLGSSFSASYASSDAAHDRISVLGEPSIRIYTAFSRPGRELALNIKYLW
ncbi:MAG: hypothetical protein K8963_01380 [Proteobacteria bacterium]|nr:hypothetical protein [Pseudomonadota bacterium]